ncbi:MAG TPA: hypothetical protein PLJ13_14825 [Cyclobacteriaceae bacterium]|nr:hypothetical protein [Cyclobacteriaceae bacterium]
MLSLRPTLYGIAGLVDVRGKSKSVLLARNDKFISKKSFALSR